MSNALGQRFHGFPWRRDMNHGRASCHECTKNNHVFSGGGLFENIYLEFDIQNISKKMHI